MITYLKFNGTEIPEAYLKKELGGDIYLEELNKDFYKVYRDEEAYGTLEKVNDNYYYGRD